MEGGGDVGEMGGGFGGDGGGLGGERGGCGGVGGGGKGGNDGDSHSKDPAYTCIAEVAIVGEFLKSHSLEIGKYVRCEHKDR